MSAETLDLEAGSDYFEGRADEDAVLAFALATNDGNDLYLRGEGVPPLYTAALILPASWEAQQRSTERDLIRGSRGGVHGQQDVVWWAPLQPGMGLRWRATTYGARQTKGGVLVTQRILVTDTAGAPLVEHFWSNFYIGGTLDADFGTGAADHTFPEEARSRLAGVRSIPVDRDQAFRYAGVSQDHAPHAMDDEAARREGYPGKILQGMCTFGLCSGVVLNFGADGDPSQLRRFAGRFSAPAFPGRDLEVHMYDAGLTPDGGRILAFEAMQDGVPVIKHGLAEFCPPAAAPNQTPAR